MCGIVGLLVPGAEINRGASSVVNFRRAALQSAVESLRHRGPDDGGVWLSPDARAGFGHRRLSVIDLSSRGLQPMLGEDGSALTYNGEVYNYRELKSEFTSGENFVSESDTEVLLKCLMSEGERILPRLDGMFAFAFYSARNNQVILATDPAGEKPLYTYWDGKHFAFASEIKAIKALLAQQGGDFSLDPKALKESLAFGYAPYPRTIYRKIRKLPAGQFQIIDLNSGPKHPVTYWEVPIGEIDRSVRYQDAVAGLRILLRKAVAKRLVADVPLGSFLSGGLDSSAVSLEAASLLRPSRLKTFSAAFSADPLSGFYDESSFARTVAERIGSEHFEVQISSQNVDAASIMQRFDEPFGDSSAIPTFLLCQETRKYLKVALSGDGGDELFGGYMRFRAALVSEKYQTLCKLILSPTSRLQVEPRSLLGKMKRFRSAVSHPLLSRLATWNAFFSEQDLEYFLGEKFTEFAIEIKSWDEKTKGQSIGEKILYYNFKTYLFDDLLPKVDRMSMAHGLEIRAPFLDKELIEFAFRLPTEFKFDAFSSKKILKEAYRDLLGKDITHRSKHGFAFPLESFLGSQPPYIGAKTRGVFPAARTDLKDLGPLNRSAKQFMLWNFETNLKHIAAGESTNAT